jgi:hypothetical protein
MPDIKPKYEVHKLPGKTTRTYASPSEKGGFEYEDKEVDSGYMVYFPNGSSIRCWDDKHLEQLGFNEPAALIDMESGDEMGVAHPGVLKARSEQKTSRGRGSHGLNLEGDSD